MTIYKIYLLTKRYWKHIILSTISTLYRLGPCLARRATKWYKLSLDFSKIYFKYVTSRDFFERISREITLHNNSNLVLNMTEFRFLEVYWIETLSAISFPFIFMVFNFKISPTFLFELSLTQTPINFVIQGRWSKIYD